MCKTQAPESVILSARVTVQLYFMAGVKDPQSSMMNDCGVKLQLAAVTRVVAVGA